MSTRVNLNNLMDSIEDLPSFPAAVQRATAVAGNPASSASDLANVIQVDPTLTAKVLKITNSAFYGLSREISDVRDAVVVLGFTTVRSLAISVSAMKLFGRQDSPNGFDHTNFWLHSTCCAILARQLALKAHLAGADDVFTAGLLHDIGKIVLDQYAHEAFVEVINEQRQQECLAPETEEKIIGTCHQKIGRQLAEKWNLPPALVEAIGSHNDPAGDQKYAGLAAIVGIADYLCARNGIPSIEGAGKPPDPSEHMKKLGISSETIKEANVGFPAVVEEAARLIAN